MCRPQQTHPASQLLYRFTAAAAGGGQPRPVLRRDMALVERIFDARDPVGIQLHPGTLTVGQIEPLSQAERFGIASGFTVHSIGDVEVGSFDQFHSELAKHKTALIMRFRPSPEHTAAQPAEPSESKAGKNLFTFERPKMSMPFAAGQKTPKEATAPAPAAAPSSFNLPGERVSSYTFNKKEPFGLTLKRDTLVIESVKEGSQAARSGIRPGSRVVGMNDMHLTSNEDYAKTLGQAMSKKEPTLILRVVLVDSATNGGGSGNGTNEFVFDKAKPIGINLEAGLLTVKSLVFGGQAEKLGVKVGTSIVFVNGVRISSVDHFVLELKKSGSNVTLRFTGGQSELAQKSKPANAFASNSAHSPPEASRPPAAVAAAGGDVVFDKSKPLGINLASGLLQVTSTNAGSQAERLGVQPGSSITFLNGERVRSMEHFLEQLKNAGPTVTLRFTGGQSTLLEKESAPIQPAAVNLSPSVLALDVKSAARRLATSCAELIAWSDQRWNAALGKTAHLQWLSTSQGRDIGLGHGHASVHTCAVIAPLTVYQHITGNDRQGSGVSDSEVEDIIDRLVSAPSRYDSRAPRHALIMCAHARAGPSHHARPAEEARADDAWHDRAG